MCAYEYGIQEAYNLLHGQNRFPGRMPRLQYIQNRTKLIIVFKNVLSFNYTAQINMGAEYNSTKHDE